MIIIIILAGALSLSYLIVKFLHFVFVEIDVLRPLSIKASLRTHQAFCPKTGQANDTMFRVFLAFCIISGMLLVDVSVRVVLSFLECLAQNKCSSVMV